MTDPKKLALAQCLDIRDEAADYFIEYSKINGMNTLYPNSHGGDYLVLDEEDLECDDYFYRCVLSGIPDELKPYFNYEKWRQDAITKGRGLWLDINGKEHVEEVNGTKFYIYRVN